MTQNRTNNDRADDAAACLEDPEEESSVVDLLCNLMHFCERAGVDFNDAVERADEHFVAELQEEARERHPK